MSATGIAAVITGGTDYALTLGAATFLANRAIDRVRLAAPQRDAAPPGTAERTVMPAPQWQERQKAYNTLRDGGMDKDQAAAELGITAETTRRDYEARWRKGAA